MLKPVIAGYRERGIDHYFRPMRRYAQPEVPELLDAEDMHYPTLLPASQVCCSGGSGAF